MLRLGNSGSKDKRARFASRQTDLLTGWQPPTCRKSLRAFYAPAGISIRVARRCECRHLLRRSSIRWPHRRLRLARSSAEGKLTMDFLSSLPEWLFDTPINFVLFTLVMLYLLSLMLENVRMNARSVSIICGVEPVCGQLADLLNPECLGKARDAEDILEMALRRNMIMLFIVKNELSGSANGVFTHLQSAYEGNENRNRYARLRYAVFGIGDSLGEDFNALAIELDLRLRKVGAQSVVPMRLFDEATSNGGVEEEFQDFLVAAGITNSSRPQPPPSAELPETSDYDLTESEESDIEHDTEAEDEERTQEIEIVEPVLETEELKANIEEPEAENGTAVAGAEESEVRVKTTSAGTETPKVGIVELAVDISTSVFESVESEAKTEEAGVGAASAQSEISRNGPEVEARPMSSGQEKSETELDEDWEIIKLMSNKDDSS